MGSSVLVGLVCLTSVLVGSGAARATAVDAEPTARTSTTLTAGQFESRLFKRINTRRVNHGCRVFRSNSALELAAQRHTSLMSYDNELSHLLPGESDLATRITQAGYTHWRRLAENLAWGQSSPRAVFRAWVHSAGHRANLDNCRLRDIGFGVLIRNGRPWVTADFGRRRT
jgi:uncharacterized protein YkwD